MDQLILYRIRHKASGQYFQAGSKKTVTRDKDIVTARALGCPMQGKWTGTGVFFKTTLAVKKHLVCLCSRYRYKQVRDALGAFYDYVRVRDFDPAELDAFEVERIVTNVQDVQALPAADIVGVVA